MPKELSCPGGDDDNAAEVMKLLFPSPWAGGGEKSEREKKKKEKEKEKGSGTNKGSASRLRKLVINCVIITVSLIKFVVNSKMTAARHTGFYHQNDIVAFSLAPKHIFSMASTWVDCTFSSPTTTTFHNYCLYSKK